MSKPRNEVASVSYQQGEATPQKEPFAGAERVIWKFSDGEVIAVALADLPESVGAQAAQFGLKTKLRNSYCDAANLPAAKTALRSALAALVAGNWNNPDRESALLAQLPAAIAEVLGITVEQASTKIARSVGEDSAAHRTRLAKIASEPRIAVALAKLRAGAPQDLEALFTA